MTVNCNIFDLVDVDQKSKTKAGQQKIRSFQEKHSKTTYPSEASSMIKNKIFLANWAFKKTIYNQIPLIKVLKNTFYVPLDCRFSQTSTHTTFKSRFQGLRVD